MKESRYQSHTVCSSENALTAIGYLRIRDSGGKQRIVGFNVIRPYDPGQSYELLSLIQRHPLFSADSQVTVCKPFDHGDRNIAGETVALTARAFAIEGLLTAQAAIEERYAAFCQRSAEDGRICERRFGGFVGGRLRVFRRVGLLCKSDRQDIADAVGFAILERVEYRCPRRKSNPM